MFLSIVGTVISVIKSLLRLRILKEIGKSWGCTWYLIFAWESTDLHGLALLLAFLPPLSFSFLFPSFFPFSFLLSSSQAGSTPVREMLFLPHS